MRPEIADKLNSLPATPGVYLMRSAAGEVFYIGKAKSLRDRVRSYFSGSDTRAFVAELDALLDDLEVVLTSTEKDAILLESELIKRHQPRFNVRLVDDKRFLCLRLDTRKPYPRLEVVRRTAEDGARYFGPYTSAQAIRETLRLINRHFQLRTCSDQVLARRSRPCLQCQMGRCPGPCAGLIRPEAYAENVASVIAFLEGRQNELKQGIERRMKEHATRLEFEQAAVLRDQLRAVERSLERQRVVSHDFADRDVVGIYREGPAVEVHVMRTRQGRLVEAQRFSFEDVELPTSDVLADFAARYYESGREMPEEVLFPPEMEWAEPLALVLSDQVDRSVRVLVPQRGDKCRLVELAARNARQAFADKQRERGAAQTAVERLQRALRLRRPPVSVECFDISHLMGTSIVASAVRFENGVPRKERYRHYRLRSVQTQDDYQSLYEVLSRRARRGVEQDDLPDLMVIDGGRGQLNAARAALDDHGVDGVEVIALAKARVEEAPKKSGPSSTPAVHSPERVFVLGQKNPVVLRQDSAELFLLTRARDEAHRFAVSFHERLRRKAGTSSALDAIPGVGVRRRRALLAAFGSVARLRQAPEEKVAEVVGPKLAGRVLQALNGAET